MYLNRLSARPASPGFIHPVATCENSRSRRIAQDAATLNEARNGGTGHLEDRRRDINK